MLNHSTWRDDCLESSGIDINSIKQCSKSGEGRRFLQENIDFIRNEGLKIYCLAGG